MTRLLLFTLYTSGHHREHLEMLTRPWVSMQDPGRMEIAAPTSFFEEHPDFADWIENQDPTKLGVVRLELSETLRRGDTSLRDVLANDMIHGRVMSRVIADRRPDHLLAMNFDHIQASLALRRIRAIDTRISGIYFRPSFHYEGEPLLSKLRKRALLGAALTNPALHRVLSFDPYAAEVLGDPRVVWLPDGAYAEPAEETSSEVRRRLGIAPDAKVALFFGVVSARKGIHELLEAVPELSDEVTVVIAGRIPAAERDRVEPRLQETLASAGSSVVHINEYVLNPEVQNLLGASDLVLLPYRRHIGSSGVLTRAIAAGVPVVGSDYGLMGRLIKEKGLGLAVDAQAPGELARAVTRALAGDDGFDPASARQFADDNAIERFGQTIFDAILS